MGRVLGDSKDTHVRIMHSYIDLMDFRSMDFIVALRNFLSGFLLPGEAQKIDRLMLKFAEKFLRDNPGAFLNAGK